MNEKAMELLKVFGLEDEADYLASNRPYGKQRKMEIARALATEPKLLLLDEPSLGLAPIITRQIFDIIKKINRENKTTIFLVEQNANLALKVADRGYVMENGVITMTDTGKNLLSNEAVKKAYLGM